MGTPSIAHFGTTLAEAPPPAGVAQADAPLAGMLGATDRFLRLAGFELLVRNLYPGVGRQYIYRRGKRGDADYVEKDSFASYVAQRPPACAEPRIGETIFRLPHVDPPGLYRAWRAESLATPLLGARAEAAFLAGYAPTLLVLGPDAQRYELAVSQPSIFQEVGYSHFRLGSPDKPLVIVHNKQAYPDTGDVSYVMFREPYLELVQT